MDMIIDGESRAAASGARMPVHDPASGEIIDTVPADGVVDVDAALKSAVRAFETWKVTPAETRAGLQRKAAALMRAEAAELGKMLTRELGRPLAGSIGEIQRAADLLDVYAEEGLRLQAEMPFGGMKESGIGREKGRWGVEDYLEYKTIYLSYDPDIG